MSIPLLSFKQAFTAQGINYYSFLNETTSPEKYASSQLKYKIFCCLWAIASIFHMANFNGFSINLTFFLLTASAIGLMAKPSSTVRLLIFISLQMYQAATDMPRVSNHWILYTFVNLTILQSYVYLIIKRKSFYIDKVELLETFAPLVRMELIALYFFAVFHKLNAGFFNTENSCAVEFLMLQNNYYNFLPSSKTLLTLNIYFTLVVETLIPLLICFRKTRYAGILLGLLFHLVLAYNPLNGFYDFSSTVFALYFLFTSNSFSNKIHTLYLKTIQRKSALKKRLLQFNIVNFAVFSLSILFVLFLINVYTRAFQDYFRHVLWTAYSLTFIIVFVLSMRKKEKSDNTRTFTFAHYSLLLFPVLVFLNGLSPYLGLKTESSYAMFSNLRTEGGITNHFIVPVSTQIFDYQKDVVQVVSSSDPFLQEVAQEGKMLVFLHFRKHVRKNLPANVTYIRNGVKQTFELSKAAHTHELLQSSYLLDKTMEFRAFHPSGEPPCSH
ncbi:hypothetical protein [Rufibacter tibetensis]|uniref:HTTM domain-containing protein n=1 Tax=Rufibacter tibetensis TaxID=512763 RepID=A0A0N7HWQ4_9BACT|nr:hypothetical protein [Rufibacter tibetensis]ALI99896.1 hypothetical protein DC20_14095 [Rufibacter tibetensis]